MLAPKTVYPGSGTYPPVIIDIGNLLTAKQGRNQRTEEDEYPGVVERIFEADEEYHVPIICSGGAWRAT